ALLINTSTRPKCSMAASTAAWHCSGSATSVATHKLLAPLASTSFAVSAKRSTRRAANTKFAPASAKAFANATPKPEEAPVTITTRPSSLNLSRILIALPHYVRELLFLSAHRKGRLNGLAYRGTALKQWGNNVSN